MKTKVHKIRLLCCSLLFIMVSVFPSRSVHAAGAQEDSLRIYREYRERYEGIKTKSDIEANGFRIINDQIFLISMQKYGNVSFIPAMDTEYRRLALFFAGEDGKIIYKTEQLETNNRNRGVMVQPNDGIAAASFQDLNGDGLTDIALITSCTNDAADSAGKSYKVGDVLFQSRNGFYRDWRISDKLNRFGMNKSIELISAFIRDGYSTEFLYTAATLDELLQKGFQITEEQCYQRTFEKLGRLRVVPGTYKMASYHVFMIYLVNERGAIVWSLQPMGDYDDLYALKGITCRDIDGDGLKDILVLARYSDEGVGRDPMIVSDYTIYYQRTGSFYADTDYKEIYRCNDEDTANGLVEKAREFWGWGTEE